MCRTACYHFENIFAHEAIVRVADAFVKSHTESPTNASYLVNRKQYVQIGKTKSDIEFMNCGVPQGSILGPMLYLMYVNDISKTFMFSSSAYIPPSPPHTHT